MRTASIPKEAKAGSVRISLATANTRHVRRGNQTILRGTKRSTGPTDFPQIAVFATLLAAWAAVKPAQDTCW